jgi:hypothetical protein
MPMSKSPSATSGGIRLGLRKELKHDPSRLLFHASQQKRTAQRRVLTALRCGNVSPELRLRPHLTDIPVKFGAKKVALKFPFD